MMDFPTIEDMFIPGEPVVLLSPEDEMEMMKFMEELEEKRKIEEAMAIMEARNTFIW